MSQHIHHVTDDTFETEVLHEKAYYISEPATPRLSRAAEVKIFRDWLLEEVTTD